MLYRDHRVLDIRDVPMNLIVLSKLKNRDARGIALLLFSRRIFKNLPYQIVWEKVEQTEGEVKGNLYIAR